MGNNENDNFVLLIEGIEAPMVSFLCVKKWVLKTFKLFIRTFAVVLLFWYWIKLSISLSQFNEVFEASDITHYLYISSCLNFLDMILLAESKIYLTSYEIHLSQELKESFCMMSIVMLM